MTLTMDPQNPVSTHRPEALNPAWPSLSRLAPCTDASRLSRVACISSGLRQEFQSALPYAMEDDPGQASGCMYSVRLRPRSLYPGVTFVTSDLHYFCCTFIILKYFPVRLSIGR